MAPYAPEVSHYDFRIVLNEDLGPEILDEGIREEFKADYTVVLPENSSEEHSVDLLRQARDGLAGAHRKKQRQYIDNT